MRNLAFALIFALSSIPAFAGSSGFVPGSKQPLWSDTAKYEKCEDSCLYEKANEGLSISALHLLERMSEVRALVIAAEVAQSKNGASDPNTKKFKQAIESNLTPFCLGSSEDAIECGKRFEKVNVPLLQKIRAAMAYNSTNAADMRSGKRVEVVTPITDVSAQLAAVNKLPITPDAPSYQELEAFFQDQKIQISNSYQDDLRPSYEPQREDYVRTRVIDDPARLGRKKTIVLTNPDDSPQIDEVAFKKASDEFKKKTNTEMAERARNIKPVAPLSAKGPAPKLDATQAEQDAFNNGRAIYVLEANKGMIDKGFAPSALSRESRRAVASASKPQTGDQATDIQVARARLKDPNYFKNTDIANLPILKPQAGASAQSYVLELSPDLLTEDAIEEYIRK